MPAMNPDGCIASQTINHTARHEAPDGEVAAAVAGAEGEEAAPPRRAVGGKRGIGPWDVVEAWLRGRKLRRV
jgi:hypothetical protein